MNRQVCSIRMVVGGEARPDLECPNNRADFTVSLVHSVADYSSDDKRLACAEHLSEVIWQLLDDHGENSCAAVSRLP